MKKQAIRNEWRKLISEITQNKPNLKGVYPSNIVRNRELLLLGQVELGKIEAGKRQAIVNTLLKNFNLTL